MNTIKIIEALLLNENGVQCKTRNGNSQNIHIRQGDLDGACAVYAAIMNLVLLGVISYKELEAEGDKRFRLEKFKRELFEDKGMHRDGNHFYHEREENIKSIIERHYAKKVNITHVYENLVDEIHTAIENDNPVMISYSYSGGAHALLAVGIELDKHDHPTKLFCLDPGYPSPKFTYWNCVIDLEKSKRKKYCLQTITEDVSTEVKLEDALIITKN